MAKAGVTSPLSSRITMWYYCLVTNYCSVHTHTQGTCLWFSKSNYTWLSPLTGMGGNQISVKFKDFLTPILASYKNPMEHTVQERISSLSSSMVAIDRSLSVPMEFIRGWAAWIFLAPTSCVPIPSPGPLPRLPVCPCSHYQQRASLSKCQKDTGPSALPSPIHHEPYSPRSSTLL